jgi:phosphopantetheinyl transferase (holo-ACP synthase)
MTGLGNDLIALKTTDAARTKSPRFYTKILAGTEQQLYQNQFAALPLEHFVWLLWSIKESAYKALQRHQPHLVFTPVKVEIVALTAPSIPPVEYFPEKTTTLGFNDEMCFQSTICFNTQTLYGRSVIYGDELIHTVVSTADQFDKTHWGFKRITTTDPASQSAAVRELLLEQLKVLFPDADLKIEKSAFGYPVVTVNGVEIAVSLSHHEGFVGYGLMK